jgi:hypothetical protein
MRIFKLEEKFSPSQDNILFKKNKNGLLFSDQKYYHSIFSYRTLNTKFDRLWVEP